MVNIFANISENNKCKLLQILEARTQFFKKNETISTNVNNGNNIAFIVSGLVEIIKIDYNGNKSLIDEFYENDIFGNMISSIENNETSVIVKEDAKIIFFDFNDIINCKLEKTYYIQFMKNLLSIIMEKLEEKNERLEILMKKTIRNKLLEYFKLNSQKYGSRFIYLPFNFTDLAEYLVIDRSAMMREIKYLKEEGFIEIKGKRINLLYDR